VSAQAEPQRYRAALGFGFALTPAFYDDWFVKRDRCGVIL